MKRVVLGLALLAGQIFAANPHIIMETNVGNIELELFEEKTPKTVENFLGLAKKGYYENVIFHRVIKKFMIQGGDPTGTGRGGESIYGKPFEDEIVKGLAFDEPYLLAMANRGPNTNGSQFFITTVPTGWLNGRHTIFGKVVDGIDVVKKIENVETLKGDRPKVEQKILKVYVKKEPQVEKKEEKSE